MALNETSRSKFYQEGYSDSDEEDSVKKDLARFLCDYSSDDLRVQSSGDMSGSFLQ